MAHGNSATRFVEAFPFTNREFADDVLPTVRAASLFAEADQPTLEEWLRELTATPEGLAATFDVLRNMKAVRRRFLATADMLEATSERIDVALVVIGRMKPL